MTNYLFDDKTQEEWIRTRDKPRAMYPITEQIVSSNYYLKNYLRKNDRFRMALDMQSFKNYIPFNIPITDIFMKKAMTSGDDNSEGYQEEVQTLFQV